MINWIWGGLVLIGMACGIYKEFYIPGGAGTIAKMTEAFADNAKTAVNLSLGMIGIMAAWLGLMAIAEKAGLIKILARIVRPIMVRLFPEVPAEHPAMGAMVMNMAANILGLGNAATPLGLKAMQELEELNPHKGIASNAMCMFLAINTSSIQLVAASAIAMRAAAGAKNLTSIIGPTLVATLIGTLFAILLCKFMEKLPMYKITPEMIKEAKKEGANEGGKA